MAKVAREVAEREFDRYCALLHAYSDAESLTSDEDIRSYNEQRNSFVAAVMSGTLTVGDDGVPALVASTGKTLRFPEPKARHLLAMDRYKAGDGQHKQQALIAELTGCTTAEIGDLPLHELRICNVLVNGFFS